MKVLNLLRSRPDGNGGPDSIRGRRGMGLFPLLAEPFSMVVAGWFFLALLWLLHRIAPAVDIIRAFMQESPLITHRLPWPQMATSAAIALILFFAAFRIVQTREF
jgi:hypothetical protein